jgi:hypothetical protein
MQSMLAFPKKRQYEIAGSPIQFTAWLAHFVCLAISELEARAGQQPATAPQDPAWVEETTLEMRDTTRPDPRPFAPQESPEVILAAMRAANNKTLRLRGENIAGRAIAEGQQFATQIAQGEENRKTINALGLVLAGRPRTSPMTWQAWQEGFQKEFGVDLTEEQAKQVNQNAKDLKLIDGLNRPTRRVPEPFAFPAKQFDLVNGEGRNQTRTPIEIISSDPDVGTLVKMPDGTQQFVALEFEPYVLVERGKPVSSIPSTPRRRGSPATPLPTPPTPRRRAPRSTPPARGRETAFDQEQTESTNQSAAFNEPASEPDARFGDERTTDDGPAFGRRATEGDFGFYTPEEEARAEEIFRSTVGPSGRILFAQNLRLENLRGPIVEVLNAAAETVPVGDRVQELNGYAIGDLAVLSLSKDRDFSLTDWAIHEGQHVAETLGLFTPQDLALLNANRDTLLAGIRLNFQRDNVPNFFYESAKSSPREMRAYAANAYVRGHRFNSTADNIFAKLGRFLDRLGNLLRGRGFQNIDDIYNRFVTGQMAQRPALTPQQLAVATGVKPTPTQTDAFRNWFGNSAVVNEDGTPKIVYHGTTETFNAFRPSAYGALGPGIYLTDTPKRASSYAGTDTRRNEQAKGGQVLPVYISMQRPLVDAELTTPEVKQIFINSLQDIAKRYDAWSDDAAVQKRQKLIAEINENKLTIDDLKRSLEFTPEIVAALRQLGYDGIISKFDYNDQTDYVVFNPTQIKSALTNNGRFDPNDPRIYFGMRAPDSAREATPKDVVENYEKLGVFAKWFGSPTQMGRLAPRYNAFGDVQRQHIYATNEVTIESEKSMAPLFANLTNQQLIQVHQIAEQANQSGKPVNYDGLPPAVAAAVKATFDTTSKHYTRLIDSYGTELFAPTGAKNPKERAALEALWAKHAGKTISQIPMADLRAANQKAAETIAELQRWRRDNYIPMMMSGSHYMAVYKKMPGGKKQLEKIAFFDPATLPQRLRGQNTEQYFRQQFEKRYPDRTQFEITAARPARMTENRDDIRSIIESRNAVNQFMEIFMGDLGGNPDLKQRAKMAMTFLDKQQLSRVFRPNDNKLLAIHDNNQASYLLDALPQYSMGVAKIYAHRMTEAPFREAIKNLHPADRQYFEQLRAYQSSPTEAFGGVRSFQFFWLLGGAIDTAAINALQPIQLTTPLMLRDGANMKHLGSAYKIVTPSILSLTKGGLSGINPDIVKELNPRLADAAERKAVADAEALGVFTPLYTNESRGQATAEGMRRLGAKTGIQAARVVNRITGFLGSLQQAVEQQNRLVTFIAAYRAAKENPSIIERANKLDGRKYVTPEDYAKGMVENSQFLITKEDRALIQRVHPIAEVATQFMSYPIKAIEQMVIAGTQTIRGAKAAMRGEDTFLLKASAFSLIAQAAPLIMLGGVFALPLAEPLKELIELVWGSGTDFDRELRQFVMGATGSPWLGTAVTRGVPHAAGAANLSRRLALSPVEFNMLAEPTVLNLLGPAGSFVENFWVFDENSPVRRLWTNGDWVGLSTLFTPRFLGNMVRGSTLAAGYDQFTRQGNTIIPAENVTPSEAVQTAFGFPPPRFTDMRDMVNTVEGLNRARTQRSQRDNMAGAAHYTRLLEAMRDGNQEGIRRAQQNLGALMQEIAEHNQRIFELAETNPDEFRRRLPEVRQWNATAIRNRALANYYGISADMPTTRMANQTVRPQLEELRELYRLQ